MTHSAAFVDQLAQSIVGFEGITGQRLFAAARIGNGLGQFTNADAASELQRASQRSRRIKKSIERAHLCDLRQVCTGSSFDRKLMGIFQTFEQNNFFNMLTKAL